MGQIQLVAEDAAQSTLDLFHLVKTSNWRQNAKSSFEEAQLLGHDTFDVEFIDSSSREFLPQNATSVYELLLQFWWHFETELPVDTPDVLVLQVLLYLDMSHLILYDLARQLVYDGRIAL